MIQLQLIIATKSETQTKMTNNQTENKHNLETQLSKENWMDGAVFYVPANTVSVIWETVFTGQKTQPTVSKY